MRKVTSTVYYFNELPTEAAKEKAREWWCKFLFNDGCDYEFIYEDAAVIGEALGIDLRSKQVKLMNGKYRWEPSIYWSGFWSQGDGACFEGSYHYKKNWQKDFPAPQDEELIAIGKVLQDVQSKYFYKLTARVKHSGHYYHEMCTDIEVEYSGDDYRRVDEDDADTIRECLREFMRWIYKSLKQEYDYQSSDEVVDETLIINQYEFDEEGNRV